MSIQIRDSLSVQEKTTSSVEKTQAIHPAQTIRILLADPHPITLFGLKVLLSDNTDYLIVDAISSIDNIVETVILQKPDIVLMDFNWSGVDNLKLIQEINAACKGAVKVVILTSSLNENDTCNLIRCGVKGILRKEISASFISQCLQRVHSGGEWLDRHSMRLAFEQVLYRELENQTISDLLSPREMNLAIAIAKGSCGKEVAKELKITEGTVRVYLNRIYDKLQVSNRLQLAMLFKNKGLV